MSAFSGPLPSFLVSCENLRDYYGKNPSLRSSQ